jgi:hypothetical protein
MEYWGICILLENIYDDTLKSDDIGAGRRESVWVQIAS